MRWATRRRAGRVVARSGGAHLRGTQVLSGAGARLLRRADPGGAVPRGVSGGTGAKRWTPLTRPIQRAVEAELVHAERVEATELVRAVEERPGMRSSSNPGPPLFAHQTRRPARAATTEAGRKSLPTATWNQGWRGLSPRTRRRAGPGSAVEARQGVVTLEGPTPVDQVVQVAGDTGSTQSERPGPAQSGRTGSTQSERPGPAQSGRTGSTQSGRPGPAQSGRAGPAQPGRAGSAQSGRAGPAQSGRPGPAQSGCPGSSVCRAHESCNAREGSRRRVQRRQ